MTDRFKKILENYQLSPSEFADRIGVQRSSMSHILSGRNKPSIDFLEKILEAFPDIDVNWLITGKESKKVIQKNILPEAVSLESFTGNRAGLDVKENKTPVPHETEPVEKIIIVYRNNTFRILLPSGD